MKHILFLGLSLVPVQILFAQISVSDKLLQDEIAEQLHQDTKQTAWLGLIKQITEQSLDTVTATYQLQALYQEFLRQTTSTAPLQFSQLDDENRNVMEVLQASAYLEEYSFANSLSEIYHAQLEPSQKSQFLFEELFPYDESLVFTELTNFDDDQKQRILNQLALEEIGRKRKLLLAKAYQDLAESRLLEAQELKMLLLSNAVFSMTEHERLATIHRMQDYLNSSVELKTKGDNFIQNATSASFSKAYSIQVLDYQMQRKILEKSTLFQP